MMKKTLALLLCGVMSMALLACCGNYGAPASNTNDGKEASDEANFSYVE